jgi:hypothetical protein
MKTIIQSLLLATIVFTGSLPASDATILREELKPLAPLLGKWTMTWTERDGAKVTGTASVTVEPGGGVVLLKVEVPGEEGRRGFSRLSVFHWQPETKTLAERHFTGEAYGMNVLVSHRDNRLTWQGHGFGPDGQPNMGTTVLELAADGSWTTQFAKVVQAGNPVPESPKITFTRVK